ncbi:MAG TPA: glycerol-3-phosphate dehydrogenase C-terminal domain-containing protein, partial [Paracoccaceae bacterium]|nr:glycerol-3-phosphate dehydrogenase C-terminal domain-containing protein [Paracoccaceae bacterium]
TDIPHDGPPDDVAAEPGEIDYLIGVVNRYFKRQIRADEVLVSFSGVRPLYDDNADNPSAVTRDYVIELDAPEGEAPILSVFGGKITTFRKLAEHALERLWPFLARMGGAWTRAAPLPGGDMAKADFEQFLADLLAARPWLPPSLAKHYARLYGTRVHDLLGGARSLAELGRRFGPDFFEREAVFLVETESAQEAADILERRTKHGLRMTAAERAAFEDWCSHGLAKAG